MNNKYYKSPKPSWLMKKFWKAAGADQYLLERSTYSDQVKYFCLGGIVVATGVLAAIAGGYAFYTIFEPKGSALDSMLTQDMVNQGLTASDLTHFPTVIKATVFGIIWGLIIFNIDRFIVTSTGKGDGTEAITKQEIKSAIPRIIMGMIIALTISKPVEIRMFQSEISAAIDKLQTKEKQKIEEDIELRFNRRQNVLNDERNSIQQQVDKLDSVSLALQLKINYEIENGGCKGKCNEFKRQQLKYTNDRDELKNSPRFAEVKSNIKKLKGEKETALKKAEATIDSMDGLLLKLQLAHEEAGWTISLFITLLFMVIELTPIFFKMMLIKGPYDYMDENVRELARAEAGIEVVYNFYDDGEGMERHKVVNHGAEMKRKERIQTIKAQEEINSKIIEEWRKKKLKDIEENPSDFFDEK